MTDPSASSTEAGPDRPCGVDSGASWNAERGRWEEGEFRFDEEAADKACAFFPKYLVHTTGRFAGRPFELLDWQKNIVRKLFGWKRPDGTRRYRKVFVGIARKNGKTTFAAGLALLILVGDFEMGGQVYSIAGNEDQAMLVFTEATKMASMSPDLTGGNAPVLEVQKKNVWCPELQAVFRPLSSKPGTKHGLNPSGVIGDEVHEWKTREMHETMETAFGARAQPISFYITTAGHDRKSLGWELWQYTLKVADGTIKDDEFLPVIHAADVDDDWTDPKVWRKANPSLGLTVQEDYLRRECERAKAQPVRENAFRRLYLNQWTEQAARWLPMDKWDAGAAPFDLDELTGRECWGGLDLARTRDLSVLSLLFPPVVEGEKFKVLAWFYCPEADIRERSRRDKVPYDQWARAGLLRATPGNVTDFTFIQHEILRVLKLYHILGLGYDRTFADYFVQILQDEGVPVVEVGQGFMSMAAPAAELERLVLGELLQHGGHPIMRDHARNATVKMDPAGNMKPDKAAAAEKMDFVASLCNALALYLDERETVSPLIVRVVG